MKFADLRLAEPILRAVTHAGYETATPIQARTIPLGLAGRDVLGSAQTGTGKTAAFALPVLHRLAAAKPVKGRRKPRVLVLCPTRELAIQIDESFVTYGKHLPLRGALVFGGVGQNPQVRALQRGVDVLIATPGRLLDLMNQGYVDLSAIETLVLDEADRMLDMGFIHDIRKIVDKTPAGRQTLLFSATMPKEIRGLANDLLRDPETVNVAPVSAPADAIDQSVFFVSRKDKPALLAHVLKHETLSRAIVFTRTKHGADRVVKKLRHADLHAAAIHGNKSQNARQRAMDAFRRGTIHILVATDVAARGIDVDGISHVINYDLTHEPETYVHRIGRTARAGATGHAVSFCDPEEYPFLRAIQKLIGREIQVRDDHPDAMAVPAMPPRQETKAPTPKRKPRRGVSKNSRSSANQGGGTRRPRKPRPGKPKPAGQTRQRRRRNSK